MHYHLQLLSHSAHRFWPSASKGDQRCSAAFCAKIFLHESPDSRWIIRSHKSQLVIYCFQSLANFPLALSFSHGTAAKEFLVGPSGRKGQVELWQNTIWEFSIFALVVWESPQVFIFPLLRTCTFTPSSSSISPHEILTFTTSAFPSFYFSHIIVHF